MTRYEYQVLEADSPTVPADMLNVQGEDGWRLASVIQRSARANEAEDVVRWIFYFTRELAEGESVVNQEAIEENAPNVVQTDGPLRGAGAISE